MSEDRSLSDFVGGGHGESDAAADGDDTDSAPADAGSESAAVDPLATTYAWSPSGAVCASCGATVERRWRDEGDLVCTDCKSW
jgi:hypothetical protein